SSLSAGSLKCYTCTLQVSNAKCQRETDCDGNAKACRTDMLRAVGLLSVITKECSLSCEGVYKDYTVAKRNISCCDADLCNRSGARGFGMSHAKVAWAVGTSLALTFLRSGP
ncbi:PREDICTED: prostate stem cell antigen-like, partial [Gekko japonicus]|uniref:Prostate stem cell antigen-like n=1 Tax=Gekko japonicus TaxID=146911 RepID=A0ABM1KUB8_GEKJA